MRGLLTIAIGMALASGAGAEDASPQELVKQGNGQLHAGNYEQAIETYQRAAELLPDSPEIAYNQAIGHYRQGDFERARELFITSLKTRDPDLEAGAKFNLGNCAYAAALGKRETIPEALEELQSAILHYKDAIETNPEDLDARINIEMAQLLMKDLLDKQQQEEQEQEDNEQQDQQEDQDDQQQEKKEEEQEGENEEQQQQSQQEQDPQQSGEQEEDQQQGEQQQDQEGGEEQAGDSQQEQEQQTGEESQEQQQAQAGEQDDQKGEERKMTREEAKRLLQLIRDKEMQRRREQARRTRVKHAPVKKDW